MGYVFYHYYEVWFILISTKRLQKRIFEFYLHVSKDILIIDN